MCIKCVRYAKRFPPKSMTFGQVKARGQFFHRYNMVKIYEDNRINIGVEAHLYRIEQAKTKRTYKRKEKHVRRQSD